MSTVHIAIPSLGNPPGEVPNDCFPRVDDHVIMKKPRQVSFAPLCQTSTGETDPSDDRPGYDTD